MVERNENRKKRIAKAIRFLSERIKENEHQVCRNAAYIADEDWYRRTRILPYHDTIKLIQNMYQTIQTLEGNTNGTKEK